MAEVVGVVDYGRIKKIVKEASLPQTETGSLKIIIAEDGVGLAKDSTLQSALSKLDVALSTRASESTLQQVRDRLLASLTSAGNFKVAISEDGVGLAKDSSLQTIISKLDVGLSTRASESTLQQIRDRLPTSLTSAGNFKIAIAEDSVGIAKDTSLQTVISRLDEIGKLVLVDYTTTALVANSTWISKVDSDPATGRIVGTVFADQPGTLYVEQSPDGTNWDVVDSFPVSANSGFGFSVEKVAPYARVRYVNGATAQTTFRLYVYARKRVI